MRIDEKIIHKKKRFQMVILILLNYMMLLASASQPQQQHQSSRFSTLSRLNTFEIENYKYQIDIDKIVKPAESSFSNINQDLLSDKKTVKTREKTLSNVISLKNIHGQSYECYLPQGLNDEDDYDEGDETSRSLKDSVENSQYNFTLINQNIQKFSDSLKNSYVCLFKNTGWWTYELCFGHYVFQYHLLSNGSILGEKINLGNFTKDFDWSAANETHNFPSISGVLYHEQYFEMGSICELNQKPRRAVVKIFCDENSMNSIDLISEVETCVYEIHAHNWQICSIPNFSKKADNFHIQCNPVLPTDEYKKYQLNIEEPEKLNQEDDKLKQSEEEIEKELQIKQESKVKSSQSEKLSSTRNFFSLFDNDAEDLSERVEDLPIADLVKIFHTKSKDNENTEKSQSSIESLNQQLKDEIAKSQHSIKKLQENAKEFEKFVDQVKHERKLRDDNENVEQVSAATKAKSLFTDTVEKYFQTDDVIDKLTKKLDRIIEDLEVDTDENEEENSESAKTVEEIGKEEDSEENESLFAQASNEKIKSLEKTLSEQFSKSEKLVKKFKANNIKVKIIRLDSMGNRLNEDDSDANLNSVISSLFQDNVNRKKIKELEENYDFYLRRDTNSNNDEEKKKTNNDNEDTEGSNEDLIIF